MSKYKKLKEPLGGELFRIGQPILDLPTAEGEVACPNEGLWADDYNKMLFHLGYIYLQLNQIEDAVKRLQACWKDYMKGPGKLVIQLTRTARSCIDPRKPLPEQAGYAIKRMYEGQSILVDNKYKAQYRTILKPWVDKWALESLGMIEWIHHKWTFEIVSSETYTDPSVKRLKVYARGFKNACVNFQSPGGRLRKKFIDYIANNVWQDGRDCWRILARPEWGRAERADREAAREKLHNTYHYRLIRERTLANAAWAFVQVKILGHSQKELTDLSYEQKRELPLITLHDEAGNLDKYFRPFREALDLKPHDYYTEKAGLPIYDIGVEKKKTENGHKIATNMR